MFLGVLLKCKMNHERTRICESDRRSYLQSNKRALAKRKNQNWKRPRKKPGSDRKSAAKQNQLRRITFSNQKKADREFYKSTKKLEINNITQICKLIPQSCNWMYEKQSAEVGNDILEDGL